MCEAAKKKMSKDNKGRSKRKAKVEDGPGKVARKKWQKKEGGRQKRKKR